MSRKHQDKQLARTRARRTAERQATRRRSRVVWAAVAAVVVVAAIVAGMAVWSSTGDPGAAGTASAQPGDEVEATTTPTDDSTVTSSPSAVAGARAVEPCPAPTDAPTPDTSLQYDQPPSADDVPAAATATIATTCGVITVTLDGANAPATAANFLFLAREGYYEGTPFHRTMADFVIQGGDPTGTGTGGPGYTIPDEVDHVAEQFESAPGPCDVDPDRECFAYSRGTLAMANAGPDTGGSQFFIVAADPSQVWPAAYTPFGMVTDGMDVVERIANGPVEGPNQDRAIDPAVITSIAVPGAQ